MSKKEKNCLNCRIYWDRENRCEVCRWEDEDNPSLFYQLTRSPEVLAPHFVFLKALIVTNINPQQQWISTITDDVYPTKEEAITATLARLKEVENCKCSHRGERGEDE